MCILYVLAGSEGGSVRWKLYREVLCQVFAMEGWIPWDFSLNTTKRSKQKEAARRRERGEEKIDSVVGANNEINRASLF